MLKTYIVCPVDQMTSIFFFFLGCAAGILKAEINVLFSFNSNLPCQINALLIQGAPVLG